MPAPHTLLCTVGTSLFYPNLSALAREPQADPVCAALARAYADQDWPEVAAHLRHLPPTERLCGAEINSLIRPIIDQARNIISLCRTPGAMIGGRENGNLPDLCR